GKWFAKNGHRNDVVLATKCRFGMGPGPNDRGASRLHIKRAVEGSLKRLGTDRIDLYQIHMQDARTPEEEVVRALDELVREGKVKDRFARRNTERNWAILATVEAVAKELGAGVAQVAFAWVLRQPTVSAAILGVRDLAQLEEGLKAAELQLPPEALARLDKV